jgi:hypothetical protein
MPTHILPRFLGCVGQECLLCKNNPHKTCGSDDNFDEAYADNQVLRARCEAEIYIDLINQVTGDVYSAPGVEVQVCASCCSNGSRWLLLCQAGSSSKQNCSVHISLQPSATAQLLIVRHPAG